MLKIIFFSLLLSVFNLEASEGSGDHDHAYKKAAEAKKINAKDDKKTAKKDDHNHDHGAKDNHKDDHDDHDDHKDEHKDDHKDEHSGNHAHNDEHKDEHSEEGFKLADNVVKNFNLKFVDYKGTPIQLPNDAIFRGLSETNVYRLRQGFYKRVDFKTLEKTKSSTKLSSPDLAIGDKLVVSGIGFLRIAEIAASGGISDSHSH